MTNNRLEIETFIGNPAGERKNPKTVNSIALIDKIIVNLPPEIQMVNKIGIRYREAKFVPSGVTISQRKITSVIKQTKKIFLELVFIVWVFMKIL